MKFLPEMVLRGAWKYLDLYKILPSTLTHPHPPHALYSFIACIAV